MVPMAQHPDVTPATAAELAEVREMLADGGPEGAAERVLAAVLAAHDAEKDRADEAEAEAYGEAAVVVQLRTRLKKAEAERDALRAQVERLGGMTDPTQHVDLYPLEAPDA